MSELLPFGRNINTHFYTLDMFSHTFCLYRRGSVPSLHHPLLSILDIHALDGGVLQPTALEVVNLVVGGRCNGDVLDALR